MPTYFFTLQALLLGLCIGSFLNVCIYRLPESLSLGGRSFCPYCKKKVAWYDNVPLLSYLLLRGRCRHCRRSISLKYPFVEVLSVFLSVLTLLNTGSFTDYLIWYLLFVSPLIVVAFIDLKHQIIPDLISLPGIPIGFLVTLYSRWPFWKEALLFSFYGMLVGGGSLLVLAYLYSWIRKREGLGGGDIKLCAMLGAFLGWQAMIFIFLISSLLGLVYAIGLLSFKRSQKGPVVIPYGPFLVLAALIYFFYGSQLVSFYFSLVGIQGPLI